MNINLNDKTLIISDYTKEQGNNIFNFITYKDTKAAVSRYGFDPKKIKIVHLAKKITHNDKEYIVCFSGLFKEIYLYCKNMNYPIEKADDKRTHFDFQTQDWNDDYLKEVLKPKFKYYDHQFRALRSMQKSNNGIIVACTSAGKTTIMTWFMKLIQKDSPVLILNDRATLGYQLYQDFKKAGLDIGFLSGQKNINGYHMVSTIQSVKKMDVSRFKVLLIDECHKASSQTYQDFLAQFPAPIRFGFSASPNNGDSLKYAKIRQYMGSPIVKIGADEMIENEVMARPTIYLVDNVCHDFPDYQASYEFNIAKGVERNQKIIDIADQFDRGVGILVVNIEQGKYLESKIEGSVFISGSDPLEVRNDVINRFNEGKVRVLIGSSILNEGISISNMYVLIQAAGQKAVAASVQRIGRVLRITPEKKTARFYDFIDVNSRHLYKHSLQRVKLYKQEGYKDFVMLDSNLQEKK